MYYYNIRITYFSFQTDLLYVQKTLQIPLLRPPYFRMLLVLDSCTISMFRLGRDGGNSLPVVLVLLVGDGTTGCCCPLAAI
jgi:hypothetical protein